MFFNLRVGNFLWKLWKFMTKFSPISIRGMQIFLPNCKLWYIIHFCLDPLPFNTFFRNCTYLACSQFTIQILLYFLVNFKTGKQCQVERQSKFCKVRNSDANCRFLVLYFLKLGINIIATIMCITDTYTIEIVARTRV